MPALAAPQSPSVVMTPVTGDADGLTHGVALAESDAGTALTLGEATTAGDAAGEDDTDATGDTAGDEDAAGEAASDGDGTPLHTPYAI